MRSSKRLGVRGSVHLAVTVVVTLVAGASLAQAGHVASGVAQFTGCVTTRGTAAGTVGAVKQGPAPQRPCKTDERVIHVSGGDMTSIATPSGKGLRGGTSNGAAVLSLTPSFRLPQACDAGRTAKWNGSSWRCGVDANATYAAGSGLSLTDGTFGVTGAPWAGLSGVPAGFADGDDDVTAMPGFAMTALNTAENSGGGTSIAVGVDGLGLISYRMGGATSALGVSHCDDLACTSASSATLDAEGSVGEYTSTTIGADGLGLIAYLDSTNLDLKVAHCVDVTCSAAATTTLDSTGSVGWHPSVTVGADGLGLIAYWDQTNADLKIAHCTDAACSSALTMTVDSVGDVGRDPAVTIGSDGLGLITYHDLTNGDLKVAHCTNVDCTVSSIQTLDSVGIVGRDSSVTVGTDGRGLISYYDASNTSLKVAHCTNLLCTAAASATLDSVGVVGLFTSITIAGDGLGLISYNHNGLNDLKVAHCQDVLCSSASIVTVDAPDSVAQPTSVTTGPDGLALVAYRDFTNGDLKVVHCSNPQCIPFVRRR